VCSDEILAMHNANCVNDRTEVCVYMDWISRRTKVHVRTKLVSNLVDIQINRTPAELNGVVCPRGHATMASHHNTDGRTDERQVRPCALELQGTGRSADDARRAVAQLWHSRLSIRRELGQ